MENAGKFDLPVDFAEMNVRIQKHDAMLNMLAELQLNMAQTVMSHHIAIRSLISALEKSHPAVTQDLRLNIDAQYKSASSADTRAALRKVIAMLASLS